MSGPSLDRQREISQLERGRECQDPAWTDRQINQLERGRECQDPAWTEQVCSVGESRQARQVGEADSEVDKKARREYERKTDKLGEKQKARKTCQEGVRQDNWQKGCGRK